jgi:hypothetical protein
MIQRYRTLHEDPSVFHIVGSGVGSTKERKCLVVLLWQHFQFNTVDSNVYVGSANGTYCYVSLASVLRRTPGSVTLCVHIANSFCFTEIAAQNSKTRLTHDLLMTFLNKRKGHIFLQQRASNQACYSAVFPHSVVH